MVKAQDLIKKYDTNGNKQLDVRELQQLLKDFTIKRRSTKKSPKRSVRRSSKKRSVRRSARRSAKKSPKRSARRSTKKSPKRSVRRSVRLSVKKSPKLNQKGGFRICLKGKSVNGIKVSVDEKQNKKTLKMIPVYERFDDVCELEKIDDQCPEDFISGTYKCYKFKNIEENERYKRAVERRRKFKKEQEDLKAQVY